MAASPSHLASLALLLLGLLPMANEAQTVYRCGNAYSHTPCAGGSMVSTDDRRSAEQKAQTDAAAAQAAQQADRMEQDRLARERMAVAATLPARAQPISTKKMKVTHPKRRVAATKTMAEPYFTASPGPNDKKRTERPSKK